MDARYLICLINKECKKSVSPSFNLKRCNNYNHLLHHYVIGGTSFAVNRFDIPQESVKVLEWFNDFWLFLEIKFLEKKKKRKDEKKISAFISLSVFQGQSTDDEKYQLFRAEWDNHTEWDKSNNSEKKHAQPHWHITSGQAIENTFREYATNFDNSDFILLLENEKKKVFDVKKIHFAMNGDWANGNDHIHKMNNEQQIVKWLQGMLFHLRDELGTR
ncbi:MAG: hypothetical protein LBE13_03235 [Bacteroidales bacterium]|jgi:hypothetical protein|nr:hypothetical protein [Bacteroidales bacterium]